MLILRESHFPKKLRWFGKLGTSETHRCIYYFVYHIHINQEYMSYQWRKRVSALKMTGRDLRVDSQMIVAYSTMKQLQNQLDLKYT